MAIVRYKVAILQIDNTELGYQQELNLDSTNVYFDNSTNGFSADNTQDAIEEARTTSTEGILIPLTFVTTGNTSDKWLGYANSAATSNTIPLVIPNDSNLYGITFSNNDDNVDIDIEIYINGSLSYTENIRNKRWYYNTQTTSILSVDRGDRVSVFLKKHTGGTGDTTAQDPIVVLYFRSTTNVIGTGGQQTGVT